MVSKIFAFKLQSPAIPQSISITLLVNHKKHSLKFSIKSYF